MTRLCLSRIISWHIILALVVEIGDLVLDLCQLVSHLALVRGHRCSLVLIVAQVVPVTLAGDLIGEGGLLLASRGGEEATL